MPKQQQQQQQQKWRDCEFACEEHVGYWRWHEERATVHRHFIIVFLFKVDLMLAQNNSPLAYAILNIFIFDFLLP